MKVAAIDWQLFWQAWRQQDPSSEGDWLARWVFADDGVWLSMRLDQAPALVLKSFDCNRGFFWDDRGAARLACASNRRSELS